ncbi:MULTISPECIES: hypothetical protein [Dactylosporangium]|uniref:Secreted protein n=1 Tax=Dactylosporangium vinaceum TaxID=53362 RepID=A0ABV5LYP2_9ACTN|nr:MULTISPECIES: hypothetical protein [Dactylosporangium]UAB95287.1 hypothetical protein Dvina_45855 [Dactylosporangium vinaceum]UWZ43613.1 hypothetical protein Dmats_40220 [Dactylosporangium matsuzakiense]
MLLTVVSLVASLISVGVSWAIFPQSAPTPVADDTNFDAAKFYETHARANAARGAAQAVVPGQPLVPKPVAGLTQEQTNNAYIVVQVGRQMNLPERAMVVAIATALQETYLKNLANPKIPASMKLPHEGTGTNYDSLGIFQQRASIWGTPEQLMDPAYASAKFYTKLQAVSGWEKMSITNAAQAVQRSAFASAYAKHATNAQKIVDALNIDD